MPGTGYAGTVYTRRYEYYDENTRARPRNDTWTRIIFNMYKHTHTHAV